MHIDSSWHFTTHWKATVLINKCKDYCEGVSRPEGHLVNLSCQVTIEGMPAARWAKEVLRPNNLRYHGTKTERLLNEWLDDKKYSDLLRRVNIVSMDFVSLSLCQRLYMMNA